MMNFTAISLTLLWNSPIYCICSNFSSFSCSSKCKELGYIYLPNDISSFKSLRSNMHHEIKFILIQDINHTQSFFISFPYFLFKDHTISLISSSKKRINITLKIDLCEQKNKDFKYQNNFLNRKFSLNLNNINLNISLSSFNLIKPDLVEFECLNLKKSSLLISQGEISIAYISKRFFIDDESLKLLALNNITEKCTMISKNNTFVKTTIYMNTNLLKLDELYFYLTSPSNIVIFNHSLFSFSTDQYFYDHNYDQNPVFYVLNITFNKVQIIQENYFENMPKILNFAIFLNGTSNPISCDFTLINSCNINARVVCEDKKSLVDLFDINIGSNSINIIPYSKWIEIIPSIETNCQFSFFNQDFYLKLAKNITFEDDQTANNYYDNEHLFQSSSKVDKQKLEKDSGHFFLYEPFFFIKGEGAILANSIPITNLLNSTKYFTITNDNINDLNNLFTEILYSPHQSVSLNIDLIDSIPIEIPSSIFFRKSFCIISTTVEQVIYFNNSIFSAGTFQNFTNVIIKSKSKNRLEFSTINVINSKIDCSFDCENLVIDYSSMLNLKKMISSDINIICKKIFINIPINASFIVYPIDKRILIDQESFEFTFLKMQKVYLITDSNSSVYFDPIYNLTESNINNRINFTFIVNKNNLYNQSMITFYNTENITRELTYFSIDARSTIVKVISVGFEFTINNLIKLDGDKSVYFNNVNSLFSTNYCLCQDVGQNFNCLDVCEPQMGPILPFEKVTISTTVKTLPTNYVNFTVYGSTAENNPFIEYSLFNMTSLDIQPGHLTDEDDKSLVFEDIAYLTLEATEKSLIPEKNVVCKLSNINFYIVSPNDENDLYLNFATAIFRSLNFSIPLTSTLEISSGALDSDVLTLFQLPPNLIFTSPIQLCNISCSTIISTIVIQSKQQLELRSEMHNITYKLDLSLLTHTPVNISCEYGISKSLPLTILINEDQPKSLADIPDLRIDVSRIDSSCVFVEFPDQWNNKIEDISSKIEIFHNDKTLFVQGKVVDDVYTTKPPTIFHNGAGFLYINGILSTFKLKYCICDVNFSDCTNLCRSIGPAVPFDMESITATIKSNPTRHITYNIFGSLPTKRPYFRLTDFAVKSFTLSAEVGDSKSMQFIDLETAPTEPVVPLNHRFISISIRPIANGTASLKFHNLYIENSMIDGCQSFGRVLQNNITETGKNMSIKASRRRKGLKETKFSAQIDKASLLKDEAEFSVQKANVNSQKDGDKIIQNTETNINKAKIVQSKEIKAVKNESEINQTKEAKTVKDESKINQTKETKTVKDESKINQTKETKTVKDESKINQTKETKTVKDESKINQTKEAKTVKDESKINQNKEIKAVKNESKINQAKEAKTVKDESKINQAKEAKIVKDESEINQAKEAKTVKDESKIVHDEPRMRSQAAIFRSKGACASSLSCFQSSSTKISKRRESTTASTLFKILRSFAPAVPTVTLSTSAARVAACADGNLTKQCSLTQISLTTDIESAHWLSNDGLLSPSRSLTLLGKRSLTRLVLESKTEIFAFTVADTETSFVSFNLSLLPEGQSVSITTLLGAQNATNFALSVELPSHQTSFDQIPYLRFDLTQVEGSKCFMIFPTSMWNGELANLSEKIIVEYGRHDFYEESSKHDGIYDGTPPIVRAIGSGGYYINGILYDDNMKLPTPFLTKKPFKSLGPSAIAAIVVGSIAFVTIIIGVSYILYQKYKKSKILSDQESDYRQMNLRLVDVDSDNNEAI